MARSSLKIAVGIFLLLTAPFASAAIFTVDNASDAVDTTPGDGNCSAAGGACTLRAAVMEANAFAGMDSINIPAGSYLLSLVGADEELAATGDLDITENLSVFGAGVTTIIHGSGDRIFDVRAGVASVTFEDLTLRDGTAVSIGGGAHGGAVRVNGLVGAATIEIRDATLTANTSSLGGAVANDSPSATLSLVNVDVTGNTSISSGGGVYNDDDGTITIEGGSISSNNSGSYGGAIHNDSNGTIDVSNATIDGNTADSYGGGINNNSLGTMSVTSTVISNNVSPSYGGGINNNSGGDFTLSMSDVTGNTADHGGGINNNSFGEFTIVDSNILGNEALASIGGGGILNNSVGPLNVTGTTIAGNTTAASGGGIANNFDGVTMVTNSTISGNIAAVSGGGVYINSGGPVSLSFVTIANNSAPLGASLRNRSSDPLTIRNTIAANPIGSTNCDGTITSAGGNVVSDASCGLTGANDRPSMPPLLGPLQNNGGRTDTHALLAGSPAIDNAVAPCTATDQRGVARPLGSACDSGAFEAAVVPLADIRLTKSDSPDPVVPGQNLTYTIVVTNTGPAAATGVSMSDPLPASVQFVSAASTVGTCTQAAGTVSCTIGTLASGASATITIIVTTSTAGGVVVNTATATATEADPSTANNSASATTVVGAPAEVPLLSWPMLILMAALLTVVATRSH